jgi:uncharacterized protein YjeT (DUF2065 family)
MTDLLTALGLAMAIEGMLYSLLPGVMKSAMLKVLEQPQGQLRVYGLVGATMGVGIVWLVRS